MVRKSIEALETWVRKNATRFDDQYDVFILRCWFEIIYTDKHLEGIRKWIIKQVPNSRREIEAL